MGHIDGVGTIREKKTGPQSLVMGFAVDPALSRYIAGKGSITIDGVSLTVNSCERNGFYVTLIPHTAAQTTLGRKKESDTVNIETDIIARYVERLIAGEESPGTAARSGSPKGIDAEMLLRHGFMK